MPPLGTLLFGFMMTSCNFFSQHTVRIVLHPAGGIIERGLARHSDALQTLTTATQPFVDASLTGPDECDTVLCEISEDRFVVNTTSCSDNPTPLLQTLSTSSTIEVLIAAGHTDGHVKMCQWVIQKNLKQYLNLTVGQLGEEYNGNFSLNFSEVRDLYEEENCPSKAAVDGVNLKTAHFSFVSDKSVRVHFESHGGLPGSVVTLHLHFKKGIYVRDLPVDMLSDTLGFVRSPCFGQVCPDNYAGSFNLNFADNELALIRFNTLWFRSYRSHCLQFSDLVTNKTLKMCRVNSEQRTQVFRNSLRISLRTAYPHRDTGFDIMFVILPRLQEPKLLPNKLFNCSVPGFHSFKPLISCNLMKECNDGDDEHDCSYRNNKCGKEETIRVGNKCYSTVRRKRMFSWADAQANCRKDGGNLPTFRNVEEFIQFQKGLGLIRNLQDVVFVGAQRKLREQSVMLQAMYRDMWQWVDGRTIFSFNIIGPCESCAGYVKQQKQVYVIQCHQVAYWAEFLCEFDRLSDNTYNQSLADSGNSLRLLASGIQWNMSVLKCPSGYVTRDFLYCDIQANCDTQHSTTSCRTGGVTVPMFGCQESRSTVHYTLVCDHMQHCSDNSDEGFCEYPECPSTSVKCRNGQCVHGHQQCDGKLDCYDGSDEGCGSDKSDDTAWAFLSPPGSIDMHGNGRFFFQRLYNFDECPPTHFLCPESFCLPVYLLCNGVVDCVGREDEVGCNSFTCPDFYRCLGSKTCLHPEHVCDGVPQCPKQDDELMCDLTCPDECRCQGLAFVCTSSFSAASHLTLRYLDASGSNMTLSEFSGNVHLIALRVSECHITSLPLNMTFPNLRELDLSWNKLQELDMQYFRSLQNLRVLLLLGNPILHVINSKSSKSKTNMLEHVDLSLTSLDVFDGTAFASSAHIKKLNMSRSKLKTIANNSFQFTERLEVLDVAQSPLKHFPQTVLRNLKFLQIVYTENFKLCCKAMLPVTFDPQNCHTPSEFVASCEDLLKYNSYRVALWVLASLSLVGNVLSGMARQCHQEDDGALCGIGVFLNSLCVADFLMGIYLTVVGSADIFYTGHYMWYDNEWKISTLCHIAGFLCVLSSEVSAFIICLITLDRCLVLCFPFSTFRFGHRSAVFACGVVWLIGISLAIIPLLPWSAHWEFYSQTGLCIPLPFTGHQVFDGYGFYFGISILLNFILFLLIAMGQAVIYRAVRANSMPSSANTQALETNIARRFITIVVSDFLCWFPIGLLGLLNSTGTHIHGNIDVAVAIFVLPINSALNPFLYLFSLFLDKRRQALREQLLKRLKQEIRFQSK